MPRTHVQDDVLARKRSKEIGQPAVGDKVLGRPASTGTRKRVNIESLASRLGPEVVGELEALVIPGSKEMPSFTARQAIQKRYNINRRHIYDWYHTKGLRVTKEDARAAAAFTPVRPQRELRQRIAPLSTPDMTFDASEDGDSSFSSPNLLLTPAHHGTGHFDTDATYSVFGIAKESPMNNWYYYYGPTGSSRLDYQPSASTTPIIPATVKASGQGSTNSFHPGHVNPSTAHHSTEDQDENMEPSLPPDLSGLLSGSERQALYDSLSGILGPSNGIEESVGTYKAYMQRQNQIYYQSLLPSPVPFSVPLNRASATSPAAIRVTEAGHDIAPLPQSVPGPVPATQYTMHSLGPGAAQTVQERKPSGGSTPARPNTVPLAHPSTPVSTVDASRFGTPHGYAHPLELGDILESPLLRSRNPSAVGHSLYAVNPVQATHPWYAHAYPDTAGYPSVNPAYRAPALARVPTWQPPYMPPPPSASVQNVQWQQGSFTAMLQDALPTPPAAVGSPGGSQASQKSMKSMRQPEAHGRVKTGSPDV